MFHSHSIIHATISAHGKRINIVSVYRSTSELTITNPAEAFQKPHNWEVPLQDTIILGSFNAQHNAWDALTTKDNFGQYLHKWALNEGLTLHKNPSKSTFYTTDLTRKPSVLDLTLTNPGLNYNWTCQWELIGQIGHL